VRRARAHDGAGKSPAGVDAARELFEESGEEASSCSRTAVSITASGHRHGSEVSPPSTTHSVPAGRGFMISPATRKKARFRPAPMRFTAMPSSNVARPPRRLQSRGFRRMCTRSCCAARGPAPDSPTPANSASTLLRAPRFPPLRDSPGPPNPFTRYSGGGGASRQGAARGRGTRTSRAHRAAGNAGDALRVHCGGRGGSRRR